MHFSNLYIFLCLLATVHAIPAQVFNVPLEVSSPDIKELILYEVEFEPTTEQLKGHEKDVGIFPVPIEIKERLARAIGPAVKSTFPSGSFQYAMHFQVAQFVADGTNLRRKEKKGKRDPVSTIFKDDKYTENIVA
ncbi:hypothetical protein EV359DRAFT_67564 [Lentinula novae-zelandiae]|nr:hypothetical protein EV359DRAFT_67564 [Lentinula novae-zelandiae]